MQPSFLGIHDNWLRNSSLSRSLPLPLVLLILCFRV